jgi:proline iminopeptidase
VLIVHGHQDPIGDKTAEDIHALVANSTLTYLNQCGHFPWLEQPDAFRKALAAFLAAAPPAR